MLLDGKTKYSMLDTFNPLDDSLTGNNLCRTLRLTPAQSSRNLTLACDSVLNGVLTNGGLTETLFHFLRGT